MENNFASKALEVNLAETRYDSIIIPDKHRWFLNLSKEYWGIHKRTEEFIREYNHPYINYEYIIENLHNIILTDIWLYNSLEESEDALMFLVDIFSYLMRVNLEDRLREQLIKTILKFIDRLVKEGSFPESIVKRCLRLLNTYMKDYEPLYIKNSGFFKTYLPKAAIIPEYKEQVYEITRYLLVKCTEYWEQSTYVEKWFEDKKLLFQTDYSNKLQLIGKPLFSQQMVNIQEASDWEGLTHNLFFNDFANHFRRFTDEFEVSLEKIYFIFYLLHLPGMYQLKNHLLYDMNRLLRSVLKGLDENDITSFIDNIIALFEELKHQHTGIVLDCILTLGKEIIDLQDQRLLSFYINRIISFGFVFPGKLSISNDWQIQVNKEHIKNIRVWLELIEHAPHSLRELLAALVVNLKLGGIFISDTDLFQRDITKLLNSDIAPVYKQVRQLARFFPVYFKEIGAEGKIREVTTAVDELSRRKDSLIHFLRKQVHTESNNTHVNLTAKIVRFWYDENLKALEEVLPPDVLKSIDVEGEWHTDIHKLIIYICVRHGIEPESMYDMDEKLLQDSIFNAPVKNERDKKRLFYMVQIHKLLSEKYSLETGDIVNILKDCRFFGNNDVQRLKHLIDKNEVKLALSQVYSFMDQLKSIILDSKHSEASESIYYKRHLAIGIPSIYGQYHEPKFEALGIMYRLEKVASRLIERLVEGINLEYMTAKTLSSIYEVLELFKEGLELDGIENQGFNSNFQMFRYSLTSPSFSFDQYINIFQFMAQNIKEIINEYYMRVYDEALKIIVPQLLGQKNDSTELNIKEEVLKRSENFYREILSSTFLIQQLDSFISNIINKLRSMLDAYPGKVIKNMMTYNPDFILSPLYKETMEMDNQVFLGAKAYYLKKLTSYGFPIPQGFVLTTEVFRHKDTILENPYMNLELDQYILNQIAELETMTKLQFGNPKRPLLFSVRSGTAISMPGAMSTYLNIGMNDEIAEALSQRPNFGWTSWDCYRRFIQSWGMSCGINRDIFDSIMLEYKVKYGVEQKIQFSPQQMKEIVNAYKGVLNDNNIHIKSEPFAQLKQAIISVFKSWNSNRAKSYRKHLQIANEWGTGVIVQKMVLGNISMSSGSGVIFTHNPKLNKPGVKLYGDFTLCSQGEDIVAGLVHTLPITEEQRKESYNECSISLQSAFPGIYNRLLELSSQLIETYGFNHQEIEFTFESDNPEDLFILQTRDQNISKRSKIPVFNAQPEDMKLVGRGIGIDGGCLSGVLNFDMEDLKTSKKKYPEMKQILVRPDTVPDDIPMIFICDGLITSRGGATSHAAVTAAKLGKVCIVNCRDLLVNEADKKCTINGREFGYGDVISIDGNLGNIYEGSYPIEYV